MDFQHFNHCQYVISLTLLFYFQFLSYVIGHHTLYLVIFGYYTLQGNIRGLFSTTICLLSIDGW